MDSKVTDLTKGVYRRMYAGFVKGRRINKLSLEAEAWFWRVLAAADDFGNEDAEPALCFAATVGRRAEVTIEQVERWLSEMEEADLIQVYVKNDEKYLHIQGFEELQPAGRNGKKVQKFPALEESRNIQVNPDFLRAPHSDSHSHSHSDTDSERDGSRAKPRSPSKPKLCDEDYIEELQKRAAYQNLNVKLIHSKMLVWCENKGKVATRSRLIGWLNREDQPMGSNGTSASVRPPANVPCPTCLDTGKQKIYDFKQQKDVEHVCHTCRGEKAIAS